MNAAGMITKYFARSFAIENVVSAPRVMRSCFPISTISISFVGLLSRSIMFAASRAGCVPVFMATATSAWARAGASLVPSPGHGHHTPAGLVLADEVQLALRRCFCKEIIDSGLCSDRRCSQAVVSGDHDRLDTHLPELGKPIPDPAFHDVF